MEKLSRSLDRFCYKHPNFGIPGLMRYIVIANVFVFLMDMLTQGNVSKTLSFVPYYIFSEFEIWRILTFIAVPTMGFSDTFSILWFAISTMCYYFIGNSLEQRWGTTRFTVFYGLGVLLSMLGGFILSACAYSELINPLYAVTVTASMYYVNLSLFFSIATLYPDLTFYLYFIIPVKAKWMGWLSGGIFAFGILNYLISGNYPLAFVPLLAIFNYFLFFWDDISRKFSKKRANAPRSAVHQTIDLKKAQKQVQKQQGYLHKCTVCGKTDVSHPDTDFRYCSKCTGYHCYCMEHINDHQHIT